MTLALLLKSNLAKLAAVEPAASVNRENQETAKHSKNQCFILLFWVLVIV
jgi:hypothetical protein